MKVCREEEEEDDLANIAPQDSSRSDTSWKSLFTFTNRSHLLVLVPCLILSTFAGALQPGLALFLGKFFDTFSDFGAGKIDGNVLMSRGLVDIYGLTVIGGATWLLKGAYFTMWLIFGELQAKSVRDELFQNLLERDLGWYEARSSGVESLLSRLQTQMRELQIGTSQPLGFTINYVVQAVTSLGLAFYYSWKLTLVILGSVPVIALLLALISSNIQNNITAQQIENQKASTSANNTLANIVEVKCFNSQDQESRNYSAHIQSAATYYVKLAQSNALQIGFMRFATVAMFVQGFYYGGHLVHTGQSTPGKVVTTFWSALMATKAFEDILPHVIVLEKGRGASIALRAILSRVGQGLKVSEASQGLTPGFFDGDIEVRNVSFAYPSRPDHLALRESTFFFPAGEMTFIVGKSGSGKSTLNNLLMRFYLPKSGEILIDGHSIDRLSMAWLRNNITLVQQQTILFNETIFRNIAFGSKDFSRVTLDQLQPCLDLADLQSIINDLPSGLQTIVGSSGSFLSGGQKQKVAIARARLRDTGVLILDESTSALDHTSKTFVIDAVRKWRKGRTTIVITHDMSQIENSDFVYMLEDGHIAQEGYYRDISSRMESFSFQFDEQNPNTASTSYSEQPHISPVSSVAPQLDFDFGWVASPCGDRKRASNSVQPVSIHPNQISQERKDSVAAPIPQPLTEYPKPTLKRKPAMRFSQRLSPRFSKGATIGFATSNPRPNCEPGFLASSYNTLSVESGAQKIRRLTNRAQRPTSVHQAFVMRSIYGELVNKNKPLPTPQILETPNFLNRMSVRMVKSPPERSSSSPESIPIQNILATVWPSVNHKNRVFLVGGFMVALVQSAIPPTFAYILVQLFQTFYLPDEASRKALTYSLAILGIAFADGITSFFMHYLLEAASQAWVDHLRTEAMRRILDQPKAWFDNDEQNSPSNLTSSLDRNAEEMRNLVGRFSAFITVVVSMMILALVWSFITCWKITFVGLAAAPVLYTVTKGFEMVSSTWERRTNTASEYVSAVFVETFSDIKTVRALTLESYFHKKFTQITTSALTVGVKRAVYSGFFFGLSDSSINFITALIFWFGARLAQHHEYSVKDILTVFSMLLFSTANANAIIAYIPQISSSADNASRLLRLSHLPLKSHEHCGRLRLSSADLATPISFINLTFYYPSRPELPALDHINLTIPNNVCTAIVGASGSGKSTVAALLLALYPPSADPWSRTASDASGGPPSLTIAGHDIRILHIPTLRNLITIVPQIPILFPASVRANITYGLTLSSALTTQFAIETAAQRAGIHEFITTLPQGYNTLIGEGGLGVSGGQAQRIVIARALVRRPSILILDEATSALDRNSADAIRDTVLRLVKEGRQKNGFRGKIRHANGEGMAGLTVIIITHSREMMACAENVVVMGKGKVLEEGGFEELIRKKGSLWELLGGKKNG